MASDKKMIAQITWIFYQNFGTFLQAYALQKALERIGYTSYIIDDKKIVAESNKPKIISFAIKSVRMAYRIIKKIFSPEEAKNDYFNEFSEHNLRIDHDWTSRKDLSEKYDKFICGSDQIWSPLLLNHHKGYYFASFAPESAIKVAYAPSLGIKNFPKEYARITYPWLSSFTALSARERIGTEILRDISGRSDIATVLDPTLLLKEEDWLEVTKNVELQEMPPYVLAYFLSSNHTYLNKAKEIAAQFGCKLAMFDGLPDYKYADVIINRGPQFFAKAIREAKYVITDSYHGTIFSIIFHTPFLTVKRFKEAEKDNQNSRIESLFDILGLSANLIGEDEIAKFPVEPDWSKVDEILDRERKLSYEYLYKSLNGC